MIGIFGLCSAGLLGFGSYKCFDLYTKEIEKSSQLRISLSNSVRPFSARLDLIGNGILKVNLENPVYCYSVSKIYKKKDVKVKKCLSVSRRTGNVFDVILPVEVESTHKSVVSQFLSDPTFGSELITDNRSPQYIFTKMHTNVGHFNGAYLTNMLREKHGIYAMFGGNLDKFEVEIDKFDSCVYLLGQCEGEKFRYTTVSNDPELLINKIVSEQDNSEKWGVMGTFLLCGAVTSFLITIFKNK